MMNYGDDDLSFRELPNPLLTYELYDKFMVGFFSCFFVFFAESSIQCKDLKLLNLNLNFE